MRKFIKTMNEFINENKYIKGSVVWKHIKDIISRDFINVDDFDINSLLETDPDFTEYYQYGEERYQDEDVDPTDIQLEIVVVDGILLDGYSRVSTLLRKGDKTTNAYVAI